MHFIKPEDVTSEIVEGVYKIFRDVCKPRHPMGKDCASEYVAECINTRIDSGGIELRVTSEFSPCPKIFFVKEGNGNLGVHFLPNLYDFEESDYPLAEDIRKQFYSAVKSYFRHLSKY